MRRLEEQAFDDAIDRPGAVMTPAWWTALLAETNQVEVAAEGDHRVGVGHPLGADDRAGLKP